MQLYVRSYPINANGFLELVTPGNMIQIVSASAALRVRTSNGDDVELEQGQGNIFDGEYARLEIANETGSDQVVKLAYGFGTFVDALISGEVSIAPASTFAHDQVAVGVAAVLVAAANSARVKGLTVRAMPGNSGTVYVGNSSGVTDADGFPLEAGASYTFENAAAVYAIADVAAQAVAYIEE